jgi:polar amino acid transport system substrate-binding protein
MNSNRGSQVILSGTKSGRWPLLFAALLGVLLSMILSSGWILFRGDLPLVSSAPDLHHAGAATDIDRRTLKFGVDYLPPPKQPEMRIYVEEGFEIELAQEIGQQMDAKIELVEVPAAERTRALTSRTVDALLVRLAPDDSIRQSAEILTTRLESGESVVMRSDRPLRQWRELAGRIVCATEANGRGQQIARALGAEVRTLRAPAQALMWVRTGECAASIHDRVALDPLFKKMSWQKFSATLPPTGPTSLVIAVAKDRGVLAGEIKQALAPLDSAKQWQRRIDRWAELVSFEVYRDQVAADCH